MVHALLCDDPDVRAHILQALPGRSGPLLPLNGLICKAVVGEDWYLLRGPLLRHRATGEHMAHGAHHAPELPRVCERHVERDAAALGSPTHEDVLSAHKGGLRIEEGMHAPRDLFQVLLGQLVLLLALVVCDVIIPRRYLLSLVGGDLPFRSAGQEHFQAGNGFVLLLIIFLLVLRICPFLFFLVRLSLFFLLRLGLVEVLRL
mmetsp:Transcript_45516/g.99117  ORF Transcript_45516/g.99117 Transcript_45516/m.99117 type:complete len:203 (-) Transcript_45516:1769-2377(-)